MDIGLQAFQPFLVGDAEMLLLIHHHQAQPLEIDAFGQERMGANHHVHIAFRQRLLGFARVLGVHET